MNESPVIVSKLRRCCCDPFDLTVRKIAVRIKKARYRSSIKNLMADVLMGVQYRKPIFKWEADCSQCGKLYWVSDTPKSMKQKLEITRFPVKEWIKECTD